MLQTAIVAMVEPPSYSLDRSVGWLLTSGLKLGHMFTLLGDDGNVCATLSGIVPLLQPIQIRVDDQPGFLLVMKAVFELPNAYGWPATERGYSLVDDRQRPIASLSMCSNGTEYAVPLLMLAPEFSRLSQKDGQVLRSYIRDISGKYWGDEPINWTTHDLFLDSIGQLKTGWEIKKLAVATGTLLVNDGVITIGEGEKIRRTSFKRWVSAGKTATFLGNDGSSSDCVSAESTGSSGGDFSFLDNSSDSDSSSDYSGVYGGPSSWDPEYC